MIEVFLKIVLSKWFILIGLILIMLFIMPANSPIGIPTEYKVILATLFIFVLFEMFIFAKKKIDKPRVDSNKEETDGE